MDASTAIAYIIVLVILVKFVMMSNCCGSSRCEGLVSRPTHKNRERMADVVMKNKYIFTNDQMDVPAIRSIMPWMDAVVFEDLRKLTRENMFELKNIYQVLG
jgi:hypothetical protein